MTRRNSAVFALATACVVAWAGVSAQVPEAELKAAFVYNFAMFTEWPRDALADGQSLLVCTTPDDDRQLGALRRLRGKTVAGHPIAVTSSPGANDRCHVVLYAAGAPIAAAATVGALTVCDGPRCSDAVIMLLREGDRIRFDVDAARAKARRLTLSSKLLRLARQVQ